MQLQDELHSFESELKVKTTKLKEENKMLLKRLSESKATSFVPGTSKPDNVSSYFHIFKYLHCYFHCRLITQLNMGNLAVVYMEKYTECITKIVHMLAK